MNMPMHIMAKPIQVAAVTEEVALFSVAETIAIPTESLPAGRSIPACSRRHKPAQSDSRTGLSALLDYCDVQFWVKASGPRWDLASFGRQYRR